MGSSFPIRNRTLSPCIGSVESWPLNHQGSLKISRFSNTVIRYMDRKLSKWGTAVLIPLLFERKKLWIWVSFPGPMWSLPVFVDFCLFNNSHSDQWEMYFTVVLISSSLKMSNLFSLACWPLYVFLGREKVYWRSFTWSLIWLFMFLIKLAELFFWIVVPYWVYNVQIPFPMSRFPFSFVAGFLHSRAFFVWHSSVYFYFYFSCLGKYTPPPKYF